MTIVDINDNQTYALVVGIETYDDESISPLNGPTHDAIEFTKWLDKRGVDSKNIGIFISPLKENERLIFQAQLEDRYQLANSDNIYKFILKNLYGSNKKGNLLYVFWGSHGFITVSGSSHDIRLMYSDFNHKESPWTLNLKSLVNALRYPLFNVGFSKQLYFIDACQNSRDLPNIYETYEHRFSSLGKTARQQFVLFAATEGATARNEINKGTGSFSNVILEELSQQPLLPPEMERLAERVEAKLKENNRPEPYWWSCNWKGSEKTTGQISAKLPVFITSQGRLDYQLGLQRLKDALPKEAIDEFNIYEIRLKENLNKEKLFGSTETIRSTRYEIVANLNSLAQNYLKISFNALCSM